MGCDGGTIPKRDELVKTKKKPEQKDKIADLAFKWRNCAISQEALVQPIMACELGRLYNKESVLEFLIDRSKFECATSFEHLRGLKDLKELSLTENPAVSKEKSAEKGDGYIDMQVADYICPIAAQEMNGKYRFCFLWSCSCVLSERALKEIKTQTCPKCGKTYTETDIVTLNGTEEETTQNQYKMDSRRVQAKLAKKAKKAGKRSPTSETVTSEEGPSSSKKLCPKTSSSAKSSHLTNGSAAHKLELTNGTAGTSKLASGNDRQKAKLAGGAKGDSKLAKGSKTIQDDPKASSVYKSLFTTSAASKNQQQGPWVTFNPQYF